MGAIKSDPTASTDSRGDDTEGNRMLTDEARRKRESYRAKGQTRVNIWLPLSEIK